MGGGEKLSKFFEESEFGEATNFPSTPDDIFSVLEALENASDHYTNNPELSTTGLADQGESLKESFEFQVSAYSPLSSCFQEFETTELEARAASPSASKRQKLNPGAASASTPVSHITVERNRRKQMNEHLTVLRSLMPCFYVKRGDQASIVGGVVNYINELQQVLQSLEAKKQRKAYTELSSPRLVSSPRPSPQYISPLSPRKPPLSPRVTVPISPRTPQSTSPYKPRLHNLQPGFLNSTSLPSPVESSNSSTSSINDSINELVANSRSAIAEVEVKFSGPNLILKTISSRIPGQAMKIISALEELPLEILQVNINTVDERMLNSFTIKIGIECQLSAEDLAQQIQRTFS